ncbi:MAG: mechanosensitive ion channel [candidate division SR1 bacterium]|nr:mechanosensitive ion channel [candidate division SR1 bacterium]
MRRFILQILNEAVLNYIIVIAIIIGCILGFAGIKGLLLRYIDFLKDEKKIKLSNILFRCSQLLTWPLYLVVGIKVGIRFLNSQDSSINDIIEFTVFSLVITYVTMIVQKVISISVQSIIENRTFQGEDPNFDASGLRFLEFGFNILVWVVAVLFVLQNRNININALVGGLGVAGIVFAFTLQNLVSDLFSSVSIYTDKPFVIGDYIQIGDDIGEVVKIGLKTTRIKNLSGDELVISNKEISTSKIKNLSRVGRRKVFMDVKIRKNEKTEIDFALQVPSILKKIINELPKVKFFAAYLKEVSENYYIYFLEFETNKMPFKDFIELKNIVNMKILETFEDNEVEFKVLN